MVSDMRHMFCNESLKSVSDAAPPPKKKAFAVRQMYILHQAFGS